MADYDWVTRRLAVGGSIDSLYDARKIAADGVTHVLNLRHSEGDDEKDEDGENDWVQKVGMCYAANPTEDDDVSTDPKPPTWFGASYDFIMAALSRPCTKILVHCQEGKNRAPSTVYFWLRAMGWKRDDAFDCVAAARPKAGKNMRWNDDADAAVKALGY